MSGVWKTNNFSSCEWLQPLTSGFTHSLGTWWPSYTEEGADEIFLLASQLDS